MFKNKNILILILLAISIISIGFSILAFAKSPKIGFVDSAKLVDAYAGFKEARKIQDERLAANNKVIDSLELSLRQIVDVYNLYKANYSKAELAKYGNEISIKYEYLTKLKSQTDKKLSEENEKLLQGVLNQVNSFIQTYAANNGFDLVIGANYSGNVLYSSEALDITEEIIKGLNKNYK